MIWKRMKNLILYPVNWFWDKYTECKEKDQLGKAIGILIASLTGLVAIGVLMILGLITITNWAINNPEVSCGVVLLVWLYMYVKNGREHSNTANNDAEITAASVVQEAQRGYQSMLKIVYSSIQYLAADVGGMKPTFIPEIEMPEDHFVIRDNLYFYQFKLEKKDTRSTCDEAFLNDFVDKLQNKISAILRNGDFPDIKIIEFRDQYGNRSDGIVVDHINDMGRYFVIYTTYASTQYMEFRRNKQMNQIIANDVNAEVVEDWSTK